ncbi:hypothetical protein VNO77_30782 [Canavalia gladiata]|uniref:Uncharacterized protein n=1 Tax=Canavalia gladiata TaxID=3824 RepID=A0AAN9KNF4_CANGL
MTVVISLNLLHFKAECLSRSALIKMKRVVGCRDVKEISSVANSSSYGSYPFRVLLPGLQNIMAETSFFFGVIGQDCLLSWILDVGILATKMVATQLALHGDARSSVVSIMGVGLNIVMYNSPLSIMLSKRILVVGRAGAVRFAAIQLAVAVGCSVVTTRGN